jgi:hypothetical protein
VAIETESERRARERANLVAALERSGGKVYGSGGAAELLGSRRPHWLRGCAPSAFGARAAALERGCAADRRRKSEGAERWLER